MKRILVPRDGSDGAFHDHQECWRLYEPYACDVDEGGAGYHWHLVERPTPGGPVVRPCPELVRVVLPLPGRLGRAAAVALARLSCDTCGINFDWPAGPAED